MSQLRRLLLTSLPKVALSRLCGLACSTPLPTAVRRRLFQWFARRYGAELGEVDGDLASFRSLQEFFRRPLRPGSRAVAATPLVWPCDGRIVTTGAIHGGRIEQVKGNTYALDDLLGDTSLARSLEGGSQATIYLAPGDYHRVHSPFAADITTVTALRGTLFPVNPPAVRSIRNLFARNSRHVFHCITQNRVPAAVVMVGAYNVGGTTITHASGRVAAGDEIGRFGFGSTVVALLGPGAATFSPTAPETRVRMGAAASTS